MRQRLRSSLDATQLPSDDALTSWDCFCRRADANPKVSFRPYGGRKSADGRQKLSVYILVVDDEPDVEALFRQQFRRDLRSGRFQMEFATSAPVALR